MKYLLRLRSIDLKEIEINDQEYNDIQKAKVNLGELFHIEEDYDLFLENYSEYEAELLLLANHIMIYPNFDYFEISHDRKKLCRRIMNLLNTCRTYLDQSDHHICKIYGNNSEERKLYKEERSKQYDTKLGYEVMERLRNYAQHKGFPFQTLFYSWHWMDIEDQNQSRLRFMVIPKIRFSLIEEEEALKKTTLEKLRPLVDKDGIDICLLIRQYIEGIGNVQDKLRSIVKVDMETWEKIYEDLFGRFNNKTKDERSTESIAVYMVNGENYIEQDDIYWGLIKERQLMEKKNCLLGNLQKRFATNVIPLSE